MEFISEQFLGKSSKIKILVLKFSKKGKIFKLFSGLTPSKLKMNGRLCVHRGTVWYHFQYWLWSLLYQNNASPAGVNKWSPTPHKNFCFCIKSEIKDKEGRRGKETEERRVFMKLGSQKYPDPEVQRKFLISTRHEWQIERYIFRQREIEVYIIY